jgi:ABC-type branched-subunit amino acid transport system substrate-binding protein
VAEQVANKAGVPLLSLAPDSTTTQINLPWIFRCVPSNKQQAEVLVRELYARRAFTKVALVSQDTRDGHLGASTLRAAVNNQGALLALEWTRGAKVPDLDSLLDTLREESVDALVLWTEPAETSEIVRHLRQAAARLDIYLSVEAAQRPFFTLAGEYADGVHILTPIEPTEPATGYQRFASEYKTRIGGAAAPAANSAYACLRLLAGAVKAV